MQPSAQEKPDDVLRAFMALELNPDVRDRLARLQAEWKKAGARVSWVAPDNLHLTLVFLGDIFRSRLAELAQALDLAATGHPPFHFTAAGAGFFGSPRAPRVLWAGVHDPEGRITALQTDIAAAVRKLGFHLEARPFSAHLTLGRVRNSHGADALTSRVTSATSIAFGTVEVRRVRLMQSHLCHQGVNYTVIHEAYLKGAK